MLKFQWKSGHKEQKSMDGRGGSVVELRDIKRRLQEDGLDPAASEEQKLRHVWQLYINTEASLKTALASIEELREQQAEEMREVENYVEHIRSLSDEREALTLEFEAENEQLKADVVRLTNALDSHKVEEIKEMLLQQSLDDIAEGTTSEQIAYLLVERARLMDELEAMETRASIVTPDGPMTAAQLFELLEQERQEFEEELDQQRVSLRAIKEKMKRAHEEEIAAMMGENGKLQEMLDHAKLQTNQLERAVFDLREQVQQQQGLVEKESGSQLVVETERASREAAEHDAKQLRLQLEELKADNTSLVENIRSLNEEILSARNEGEVMATRCVDLENEAQSQADQVQNLQECLSDLQSENSALQRRVNVAQDEVEDLRQQSVNVFPTDDLQLRLKTEIEDLRSENQKIKEELTEARLSQTKETAKISSFVGTRLTDSTGDNRVTELQEEHERETAALKLKIRSLETKVSSLEGDLATSQKEVWSQQTEFKKLLAQARAESSSPTEENDLRFRRHSEGRMTIPYGPDRHGRHLARRPSDGGRGDSSDDHRVQELSSKVKELNDRLQVVKAEKDEVFNLLETQRQQNSSLRQEMADNMARLSSLQTQTYQLETDNKDLSHKLKRAQESTIEKESQLEKNIILERRASEEKLNAAHATVEELQKEVERLRQELSGAKHLGLNSQPETEELRSEVDRLHSKHQGELSSISQRLQAAYNEVTELKNKLGDREEELTRLRNETNVIKSSETKLKTTLECEEQGREALQATNIALTAKNEKAWSEVQHLSMKVASLEATNENLRQELDRKTTNYRESERIALQRASEQTTNLENASRRAEAAETRLRDLQCDLESAVTQLQVSEGQLRESATLRAELKVKRDEIGRLREQLQDEQIYKTHVTQGSEELASQLAVLREKERVAVTRSNELQHMLLDVEAKLDTMKDQTHNTSSLRFQAEVGKKELLEQVTRMQWDLEALQVELSTATERYDAQVRKYNERKLRTKNKLQKARELFHSERTKYCEEIERLQEELQATRANMNKDTAWKDQLEEAHRKLLNEKRDLLTQAAEQEETVHDQARSLSVLQVRARYLEEENQNLQTRIDSLTRQKSNLDKLIKEYQLERHKEAIDSMSTNIEALMSPRINTNVPSHVTSNQIPVEDQLVSNQLLDALISPSCASPGINQWHPDRSLDRPTPMEYSGVSYNSLDPDSDGVEL